MADRLTDLHHLNTLAVTLAEAFPPVAQEYGVRLEGIEDDINEHTQFWLAVARRILNEDAAGDVT